LYDDAINIFKNTKYLDLLNNLFKNRQAKITYFLCAQDGFSLPVNVKRNLDSCVVFGGYNDSFMLGQLFRQLSSGRESIGELMNTYKNLINREGLMFDYDGDGMLNVKILQE
jgi:hypothetical protein